MKKTRFSEEQMVRILREADAAPVAGVTKKHGIRTPRESFSQLSGCARRS